MIFALIRYIPSAIVDLIADVLAINGSRQVGWMIQCQYYWWGQHCLEVYLGWKLFRKDSDKRCMVAARISPFRRYEI